jgi:tetratricopeptide (TPR) repeat protein
MTDPRYDQYREALRLGHLATQRERYDAAAAAYREAARLAPDRALPLIGLGGALAKLGRTDDAIGAYAGGLDRAPDDVFAIQDEITDSVIGCIQPELYAAEHGRVQRKPPQNLDAWESFVRGMFLYSRHSDKGTKEALDMLARAIREGVSHDGRLRTWTSRFLIAMSKSPSGKRWWPICWIDSASSARRTFFPINFPAANSNSSRWRARSSPSRH